MSEYNHTTYLAQKYSSEGNTGHITDKPNKNIVNKKISVESVPGERLFTTGKHVPE